MLSTFARETITRIRYPRITDGGVDVADRDHPERTAITGCWLEPARSAENTDGRAAVFTGWTVAAPPTADVRADDHIEYQGIEYEVLGDVLRVPSPTGALAHTQLTIQRWEG
ncbi:hypothetical protein [Rathayibacter sp. VKM Ac-2927]|uniref:hypothetical protein n=1 Tax=Rathayibacter sp. VKM Ac-2927 TaxID=2929478 RepID=UPI001FB51ABA|nr:hypothetical protein [Rathayibacter sp. VKM Ac-2927]MCJ1687782.1 hypothetical protein [Rathayibacter sp. VKM Ac-2927]